MDIKGRFLDMLMLVMLLHIGITAVAQDVLFSGEIKNHHDEPVTVFRFDKFEGRIDMGSATIKEDGSFSMELYDIKAGKYYWQHNEERTNIYLMPDMHLRVTVDYQDFDRSLEYSGTGADESNYLADHYNTFLNHEDQDDNLYAIVMNKISKLSPDEYKNLMDSLYNIQLIHLNEWKSKLSDEFYTKTKGEFYYQSLDNKYRYTWMRDYISQQNSSVDPVEIEDSYFSFLEDLYFDQDMLAENSYYIEVADQKLSRYNLFNDDIRQVESIEDVISSYKNATHIAEGMSLHHLRLNVFINALRRMNASEFEDPVEMFMNSEAPAELKEKLNKYYRKQLALSKGNVAPDFTLINLDGDSISLRSLMGKVTYLDFWASWCAPCIMEFKHLPYLKEKVDLEKIQFLYISIDEDEESWRKAVEKHQLSGVHLWAKGFQHEVPKLYQVRGIPKYFILDADNIILDDNPPRPSTGEILIELLNGYIDQ